MGRKGFIIPNKHIIKILFKAIPSSVFGGHKVTVNDDGSLNVKADDTGTIGKVFIGNPAYYKSLLLNNPMTEKLPRVIKMWLKTFI